MRQLIAEIRARIPFGLPEAQVCGESCQGCSLKLMEHLAMELEGWESRLAKGETPTLGDLHRLGNNARKIHRVLEMNRLV